MTDKRKIDELIFDHANANKGTERGRYALEASLRQYGAGRSILLDRHGRIIAGNKTAEVAADVGLEDVIVVQTDGKQIVAVQRTDLDIDSPEGRGLAYADNRVGELSLEWDAEQVLADLDAGVDLSALWRQDELDELLADLQPKTTEGDTEPQIDRAEELRQKWGVEPGQLWQLGEHRLICGDCTDAAVVARVMGGERADMVFTDPPYGVEWSGKGGASIEGDITGTLIPLMFADLPNVMADRCWVYVCGGAMNMAAYGKMFDRFLRAMPRIIVWDKGSPAINHNGYHFSIELIYYGFTKGAGALWFGSRAGEAATDIWRVHRPTNTERVHLTEKPVELPARAIGNSCPPGGIVWEPFSGSGSTLIACENLGRRCRAVEIAPGYVAAALERWATHTGKTPVKLG